MRTNLTEKERDACLDVINRINRIVDELDAANNTDEPIDPATEVAGAALNAAVNSVPFDVHLTSVEGMGYISLHPRKNPNFKPDGATANEPA